MSKKHLNLPPLRPDIWCAFGGKLGILDHIFVQVDGALHHSYSTPVCHIHGCVSHIRGHITSVMR